MEQRENILDDIEVRLIQAENGPRFVNLLIDWVFLYLLWKFALSYVVVTVIVFLGLYIEDETLFILEMCLFVVVFDILIFAALETLTKGRTLGKLITRTRAVNADGTTINFKKALLRSICRMVPLEAFSALSSPCYPWHDRWTGTIVIDDRGSTLPM